MGLVSCASSTTRPPGSLAPVKSSTASSGPGSIPVEAEHYSKAIDAVLDNKRLRQNIEEVYESGLAASARVSSVVERLSDEDFSRLQGLMKGFDVMRIEYAGALPSSAYFLKLAQEKGRPEDREFFQTLNATRPGGPFPMYAESITDYTSCLRFGSGKMVELYGYWKGYQLKHRKYYVAEVKQELGALQDALAQGTCACGEKASVLKELQDFTDRYGGDPFIEKVRGRLQDAKADRAGFQYNCRPS